jgi:hypothetical protein
VELVGPPKATSRRMKKWQLALQGIASLQKMGIYFNIWDHGETFKNTHQNTEWNLDADAMELYRHKDDIWTKYRAINYGRLRLESAGVTTAEPRHITHKADGTHRRRQIDMS